VTTYLHRPVRRELAVPGWNTQVVTLAREGIWFRPKGRRLKLLLPWSRAILLAARLEGEALAARRRAARKRKG
jgi:hypothetical protein